MEMPISASGGMSREETERALEDLHLSSFGWAMSCCRFDREEASDVLQTSYLKILDGKARFNGHSSIRTWIFGVVRRTATERRRRRLLRDLALARWARGRVSPEPTPTPEILSHQERTERRLRAMLLRLSSRQRELLHLVFYEETTIEEAARILGISVGTARIHYERGKTALRGMLSASGGNGMEAAHGRTERERSGDPHHVPDGARRRREIGC
jgi:RNA polymerase sigma-70 factor (ECF subfamily)